MSIIGELNKLEKKLEKYSSIKTSKLYNLMDEANEIGKSWSGSWFGYHSRVYYRDLKTPPSGAHFSREWGFKNVYERGTIGDWVEYQFDDIVKLVFERAKVDSIDEIIKSSDIAGEIFEEAKTSTLSLFYSNYKNHDKYMDKIIGEIEKLKIEYESDYIHNQRPKGRMSSRDTIAIEKGLVTPPHISILTKCSAIKDPFISCDLLKKQIKKLSNHVKNIEKKTMATKSNKNKIFIGHGGSALWRELKDFVNNRLKLSYDEFNRVPIAGLTTIARLKQMLEEASIAFLVLTAEDELSDGKQQARMNVIHEVGLFQGKLGFEKAFILLEEDCEEFSNIYGLGQIRFPKGNISAKFEEIRRILEKEGMIT